jgi:hypothetical protein
LCLWFTLPRSPSRNRWTTGAITATILDIEDGAATETKYELKIGGVTVSEGTVKKVGDTYTFYPKVGDLFSATIGGALTFPKYKANDGTFTLDSAGLNTSEVKLAVDGKITVDLGTPNAGFRDADDYSGYSYSDAGVKLFFIWGFAIGDGTKTLGLFHKTGNTAENYTCINYVYATGAVTIKGADDYGSIDINLKQGWNMYVVRGKNDGSWSAMTTENFNVNDYIWKVN